jgi:hypothetical protein
LDYDALVGELKHFGDVELGIYTKLHEAHSKSSLNNVYQSVLGAVQSVISGLDDILSRHDSKPQETLDGKIKELINSYTVHGDISKEEIGFVEKLKKMISYDSKPRESLAELADRKGFERMRINQFRGEWFIRFLSYTDVADTSNFRYKGKTYQEAEQKARQYLEGLPDVK